jgi:hypothetical protein
MAIPTNSPIPAEPTDYQLTVPEAHFKVRGLGDITRIDTNALSISILGVLAGFVIIIMGARAIFGLITSDEIKVIETPPVSLTNHATATNLPLSDVSVTGLDQAVEQTATAGPTEFRLVDEAGVTLQTLNVLSLLGLASNSSLNRLITDVRLLSISGERAIVFSVTDATSALGLLLSIEPDLPSRLTPVLHLPPHDSVHFTDETLGQIDLRVYTTDTGEPILAYGFIDKNTVIITRNTSTIANLLGSN